MEEDDIPVPSFEAFQQKEQDDKDDLGYETWPGEPPRMVEKDVDDLLAWCVNQGSSDISLQTDRPCYIEVHGELQPAMRRPIDSADMAVMLARIYGVEAQAKLAAGKDLDLSYEVKLSRYDRIRFRVNITAILSKGRDAVQITLRCLPNEPPRFEDLGIEEEIIRAWSPRQGLILITGPTGSGKSTLLAAGNRMMIERGCGKLLTYEAPIEYTYDTVVNPKSLVSQSEIPRHVHSFADGVRNALRRKPEIILVGEARDKETVSAAIEAGQTGHAVYATAHTTGVAATIRRMVAVFDPNERTERAFALMETLRLVVTQALLPKVGGGRCGLREWLVFDDELREEMLSIPHDRWTAELERKLPERGRQMKESARIAFEAGDIDRLSYLSLSQGGG